jgi:Zn-dependent peptidase ImmA (M78 family)/DNA-binding XRE family transcriptional regulator
VASQKVELPEKWVTPEVIRWAREQVGLDIEQAAQLIGNPPHTIMAWETGEDAPALQDLENLGELYDCPIGYFFLDVPPKEDLRPLDYRGISSEKKLSYESLMPLRRFSRLVDLASNLVTSMNLRWELSMEPESLDGPIDDIAARSAKNLGVTPQVLSELNTDEEAFNLWRSAIEKQGILVLSMRLNVGELRGASSWNAPSPPAILVNHADIEAMSGRTFTLLHEYAHLLVKHPGIVCDFRGASSSDRVEQFANRFAARAMVPITHFRELLVSMELDDYRDNWNDDLLGKLRQHCHASRDVISILLEELNLAPKGFYPRKRAAWDRRRQGGRGRGGRTDFGCPQTA